MAEPWFDELAELAGQQDKDYCQVHNAMAICFRNFGEYDTALMAIEEAVVRASLKVPSGTDHVAADTTGALELHGQSKTVPVHYEATGDAAFSTTLEVTGRSYGLSVRRAPALGSDVAIAVLRSET